MWAAGTTRGGVRHLGLTHMETWGGRWWMTAERRCVGNVNCQTTPAATSTTLVHQLLGTANTQTAPAATSTAPAHQQRGSTQKQHQQEHRPQQPTKRSNPTQHAKVRTGDCPGPCKETATRRNVTQGAHHIKTEGSAPLCGAGKTGDKHTRRGRQGNVMEHLRK